MLASWRAAHAYSPDQDVAEGFIPMKPRVRIRLGLWDDILAQTLPADAALSSVTLAMMHCARTVALANTHRTDDAEIEKTHFLNARDRVPATRMLFNNRCPDILMIAEQMMQGELAFHKGQYETAFAQLRSSVDLDDNLPYDEPWGWMQPSRHALWCSAGGKRPSGGSRVRISRRSGPG